MAYRAPKSGIALEAQQKMTSKWDPERTKIALRWVGDTIGRNLTTEGTMDECFNLLHDGEILSRLANWIKPGAINEKKFTPAPTAAFKRMELIGLFIDTIDEAKGGHVKKGDLFQTTDLYDRQNLVQVIQCIEAVGRAMNTIGRAGFGKAESTGVKHNWTDEQLNAGKNVIGLQMGSNKGATQAGQNFGKSRDIMS
jgi:hypothetical protein